MRHDGHCVLFVGRSEADMESVVYQSPDVFSFHYFFQVAVHVHVENVDGQMVFLAHRSCGEVHYFQAFVVDFIVCDFTELRGRGVFSGSAVYTPSTRVPLSITSASISMPRNEEPVSVVK